MLELAICTPPALVDSPAVERWRALAEIDENLIRADLTVAQRAKFTAARKKAYLKAHPETGKGGDRKSKSARDQSAKSALRSFVKSTVETTGRSHRAIEIDAARGEALEDDLDSVVGTSLDKGIELDAMSAMSAKDRAALIARAASGEAVSAIRDAAAQEPKPGYADLTRS